MIDREKNSEGPEEQGTSALAGWRQQIEKGWLQAERDEVVDGPRTLTEIRQRITARQRSAP